jgi:chemotaxis response regulator CheB
VIRVVIVADSGTALRRLSETIGQLPDVHIVRYCSGRGPVEPCITSCAPDLVLVDEMHWPRLTLRRIAEITAPVIVCTSRPEARWLADALRAGARAVVPHAAGAATLRLVMEDVLISGAVERPRPHPLAA